MSAGAISWAWERRGLDLLPRLVLLALADFANSKCDVAVPVMDLCEVLSHMTEASSVEVQRARLQLENRALIEAVLEGRGYSLLVDPHRLRYEPRAWNSQILNRRS